MPAHTCSTCTAHLHPSQAAAFAGDAAAARRLPPALASLQEQLGALEAAVAAMARDPPRFGLTQPLVQGRRGQVESLKFEVADLARSAASLGGDGGLLSSSGSYGGFQGGGGGGGSGAFQDIQLGDAPSTSSQPARRPLGAWHGCSVVPAGTCCLLPAGTCCVRGTAVA